MKAPRFSWAVAEAAAKNWPQFRGPASDGRAVGRAVPLKWSEQENIRWKTRIHDFGHSSPVVWGGQVWVTTATQDGKHLFAVCCDRATGRIVHDIQVFEPEKPESINALNTYATPTPVIEEGRVYVHFGTYGTACLDARSGQKLWERTDLHCLHMQGPASSPILFGQLLILDFAGGDVQFLAALEKTTGKTAWLRKRSLDLSSLAPLQRKGHCTPIIIDVAGRPQLFSPASHAAYAYDPYTGEELWKVRHQGDSVVLRPLFGQGLLFFSTGFSQFEIWAVRPGGRGDVTQTQVAWKFTEGAPRKTSPVLAGGCLFLLQDDGALVCLEASTGKLAWKQRMGGQFSASPVTSADRIYCFDQSGQTTVLAAGQSDQPLAVNQLDEGCFASPAAVDGDLFLRGKAHLYRIGN
ncbi:MAG: PQQ-binding-like beta-propeller repeat protein [Kiritimatiellaeota bacterium]|nr:PQQ-binding-like beta-propeller repeat protein [Kiritimatiellota bacterium]